VRVGLTGGIGSGKSEVARILEGLGARVIDADVLAREAVAPGTEGFRAIEERWPQVVRDGAIDRAALGAIVFADPAQREALNGIVHPQVRALSAERERALGDCIVLHVVPLLFEGQFWKKCDATILVAAPKEIRIARVAARDGLGRAEIEHRMAAQIDPAEARKLATYTIENDGDLATLGRRSAAVWESLVDRCSPPPAQSGR
jgi:dephospho-CoA kinase